jgi:hypothetical protein
VHGITLALPILADFKNRQHLVTGFHHCIHRAVTLGPLGGDSIVVTAAAEPSHIEDVDLLTPNLTCRPVEDMD